MSTSNAVKGTPVPSEKECEGFKVGDRVKICLDSFDKATQKQIAKEDGVPVGESGVIKSFRFNPAGFKVGMKQVLVAVILSSTKEIHEYPVDYFALSRGTEVVELPQQSEPVLKSDLNKSSLPGGDTSIQSTIKALLELGCPPLPVAPKQDPRLPNCHHQTFLKVRFKGINPQKPEIQGDYCRISFTKVGDFQAPIKGDYCRLDENLQPITRFTGKNPSYLDRNGKPHTIQHREYQNRMPTEAELNKWFANPLNGIGTLGGHNGVDWLDFDAKNYPSQEECDREVGAIRQRVGATWVERTGSGGYRIAVRPQQKPTFTNFSTDPSGDRHIGEALWEGRFTVLAPTIHPTGNPYQRIELALPIEIESLEAIGIYPTKDEQSNQARRERRQKSGIISAASDPRGNPWDIRNFAEYLDGSHVDGNYYECRCPVHKGDSDNSLSIAIDSGAFWCWSGCDTKEIYQEAKKAAIAGGYQVPESTDKQISREEWLKKHGEKVFQVKKDERSDRDRHIKKRNWRFLQYWNELKKDFTLTQTDKRTIQYYEGYAPTFELSARSILLRGWLGAGKTEAVLRSLFPHRNLQIIWVTGRNGLLRQTEERAAGMGFTDIYHYQDDPGLYREMLRTGHPGLFMLCPDSLKDYATKDAVWHDAIVVIDEFSGVRRDVLKKSAIMPEFERLLSECGHLIAVDAFLSDVDARVISRYRGRNRLILDQVYKKSPKPVHWLKTRNKKGETSMSHDGIFYPLLKEWVEEQKRFVVCVDNKLLAKAIDEYLQMLGYEGVVCSSETVESNKILLPNPDPVLSGAQYFVYTPTAQSGLDCQAPFDCGLAIYTGVLSPVDFMQMPGRARQCKEWYVSAPMRAVDPSCATPSLDSDRVKGWVDKLAKTYAEFDIVSGKTTGWGLWQSQTHNIEKAFPSEYLRCLFEHFFESVETLEVRCDRKEWQAAVKRIKRQETKNTLAANLANGQRLLSEQKPPSKDAEVWDIALAQEYDKYPQVWQTLIEEYKDPLCKDAAIDLAREFIRNRVERIKYWVQATGEKADTDLAELEESMRGRFVSYVSPRWKAYQNLSLFQTLNLERLAVASSEAIAHATHFRIDSPLVGELYDQFQQSAKLQRLFPAVESIQTFWAVVKSCMSYFGYQGAGKSIRVDTPGALHPNGTDRHGKPRQTESAPIHFSGWWKMGQSGNAVFQENFNLIIQSIRDRLDRERQERREQREQREQMARERERMLAPPVAA